MKKIISYILAICICSTALPVGVFGQIGVSDPVSVSAQTTKDDIEDHTYDDLKSVTETFGDDAFVYYLRRYRNSTACGPCAMVITPDGKVQFFNEAQYTSIKVKEGTSFDCDDASSRINQYSFYGGDEDQVILRSRDDSNEFFMYPSQNSKNRTAIYNALREYDQIESITEHRTVKKIDNNGWICSGIYINKMNNVSPEDIIEKYPSLGLKYRPLKGDEEYYYLGFPKNPGKQVVSKEIYSFFRDIFYDYPDSYLPIMTEEMTSAYYNDYYEANTVIYNDPCSNRELEPFNMIYDTNEYYKSGTLDDYLKKVDDDLFVYYKDDDKKNAFVITPDGLSEYFHEGQPETIVKVKDDKTLPVDEISDQIKQYTRDSESEGTVIYQCKDDSSKYYFYVNDDSKTKVYDILKKCDAIQSISESRKIDKAQKNSCSVKGVYINNSNIVSDEDITERYAALGLKKDTDYLEKENYTYYAFDKTIGGSDVDIKTYRCLKKLFNDCSDSVLELVVMDLPAMHYSEINNVVYNYVDPECFKTNRLTGIPGDINCSGDVDLGDLVVLSMHLLGDIMLPDILLQQADCNGDGDVDIADLPKLKQYIMHDDVKLG